MNLEKLLTDRLEGTRSERVSLKAILEVHEEKMKKLLNQLSVLAKAGSSHRDTEVGSSDNPELHVSLSCSHIDCNRLTYIHALPLQGKVGPELYRSRLFVCALFIVLSLSQSRSLHDYYTITVIT
jgi:hypothetical protein